MSATAPMLELEGVTRSFGDSVAVAGLDLQLARGEFLSLLGPSGCGKSTTLAMIAGFLDPDSGRIRVDGRDMRGLPPRRRGVGLVFQDYALFSSLSVRANLAFGLQARGVARAERGRRLATIADRLGLGPLLHRPARALNMSEMQRVAIGRALVTEPALLLLDEPLSNLDAHLRQGVRSELKRIQGELGQTVLYVTHDQLEAMSLSDRIAVMHGGRLQQVGRPREIYDRPANRFVAEFIGDPPVNILPCTVAREPGGVRVACALTPAATFLLDRPIAPGEHVLALRPHAIRACRSGGPGDTCGTVRYVENLGAQHVLHVEVAGHLVRVQARPGLAGVDEVVHLAVNLSQAHLIDNTDGRVAGLRRRELAA